MAITKRINFSLNDDTEIQIKRIVQLGNYDSASDLIRQLVEREAIRLGLKSGEVENTVTKTDDNEMSELYKKVSLLMNITKESDDKLYVILDCINNLMQFMEIGGEFKSAYDDNAHSFVKMSEENLKQEKYISQLNKY